MLNPVVLPLPAALLILATVTAALIYRDWLAIPAARRAPATGRHRLGAVPNPYLPRAAEGGSPVENLAARVSGSDMWSWSDERWSEGATRELAVVA
jgi:hypothetical protein